MNPLLGRAVLRWVKLGKCGAQREQANRRRQLGAGRKSQVAAITTALCKDIHCCSAIAGLRISIREMFHLGNSYTGRKRSSYMSEAHRVCTRPHARTHNIIEARTHAGTRTRTRYAILLSKQKRQHSAPFSDQLQELN